MKKHIYYEDLSASEKKELRRLAFRKEKKLKLMNAFFGGFSVFVALLISRGAFPQSSDTAGRLLVSVILTVSFSLLLNLALIEPRVVRIVERLKNEEEA